MFSVNITKWYDSPTLPLCPISPVTYFPPALQYNQVIDTLAFAQFPVRDDLRSIFESQAVFFVFPIVLDVVLGDDN